MHSLRIINPCDINYIVSFPPNIIVFTNNYIYSVVYIADAEHNQFSLHNNVLDS